MSLEKKWKRGRKGAEQKLRKCPLWLTSWKTVFREVFTFLFISLRELCMETTNTKQTNRKSVISFGRNKNFFDNIGHIQDGMVISKNKTLL